MVSKRFTTTIHHLLLLIPLLGGTQVNADMIPGTEDIETVPYEDKLRFYHQTQANADRGQANAQYLIGEFYMQGCCGYGKNYIQAYKWFYLAALQGHKPAQRHMDELTRWNLHDKPKLTSEQVIQAQKLARSWKPKP